jgi:hypothetical protein
MTKNEKALLFAFGGTLLITSIVLLAIYFPCLLGFLFVFVALYGYYYIIF